MEIVLSGAAYVVVDFHVKGLNTEVGGAKNRGGGGPAPLRPPPLSL